MSQDKAQPLPKIRNVALAPTPDFTGRADELHKLRQLFDAKLTGTVIVAVHGLGGVGKTQIALRYARTYATEYDVVWWLRAEQPATLAADFADLAKELGVVGREPDQRAAIDAVKKWLARNARWLLVFDSVREPRDIEPFLVPGAPGQVLVTSRHASWVGIPKLHLRGLRRADAIELLLSRSGVRDRASTDQRRAADRLAEALGDLPLALAQASAFMEEHAHTIDQYLALFHEREQDLMSRGAASETAPTVATTWDISFRKVAEIAPAAAELLALCAFLAPDDIPRDMLRDGDGECPPDLAEALRDPIKLGDQIAALRRYSLIEVQGDDALSVHRLVQSVVRERLSDDERRTWASRAAWLVNQIFPTDIDDPAVWPKCRRLLPHARAVSERAGAAGVADEAIAELYHRCAKYSRFSGAFAEAHDLYLRALALATPLRGGDDPEIAALHRGLALTLVHGGIGDPAVALRLAKVALTIDERAFGPDDEVVARDHWCLMKVNRALGDRAAVSHHIEHVIRVYEKIYGLEDPRLIPLLNDRGFLLREDGKLAEARALLERALLIDEHTREPGDAADADVATIHSTLAGVLEELKEFDDAEKHARSALAIGERHYGPDHYAVAIRRNNLGVLLWSKRDLEGAKAQFERAVEIGRKVFAPGHRRLQKFENNLQAVLAELKARK